VYNGKYYSVRNFIGGYCGNLPADQLQTNQANDLDNIVLKPSGLGFRTRLGNSKLNASAMNSGAAVQGLGFFLKGDLTNWLMAISGAKIYSSSSVSGTFTDVTGSYSGITAGATNKWDIFTFNDAMIGFGGDVTSPDVPIRWPGTGTVAALTGTPPQAYGGFTANNRVFGYRTNANPSTIYWSIIGNAQDWTGSGSGQATVGSVGENQKLTAAIVISTNYVLLFKDNSTYQMVISSSPFPVYTLFDSVGCIGKHAAVNVDGKVYFITSEKRMRATDGEQLEQFPTGADDLWNAVDTSTLQYTEGVRQKGADYDWLVWIVTIGGTKRAIVWDLLNKCWLRHTTGYKMNTMFRLDDGRVFMGGTDGFIYIPDTAATYADASENSPGTITAYWRSGWMNPGVLDQITQVQKLTAMYSTKASGNITIYYGFNYLPDTKNFTLSQVATSTEVLTQRSQMLSGRGNTFQFKIQQSSSTIDSLVSGLLLNGKVSGQKRISAG
jgi:hypothetical protein